MTKNEKQYEVVGNIRIKQPKTRGKKTTSVLSVLKKVGIWILFISLALGFIAPLILIFNSYVLGN